MFDFIIREFIDFLANKGAYDSYIAYGSRDPIQRETFFSTHDPMTWVSSAFNWGGLGQSEPHGFWSKLSEEWQNIVFEKWPESTKQKPWRKILRPMPKQKSGCKSIW